MHIENPLLQSNNTSFYPDISLHRSVRFWLLLLFNIPSIFCSLFLFNFLFNNRSHRRIFFNHTIIFYLLFSFPFQFIDIPLKLIFFHFGFVWPQLSIICLIWWFIFIGLNGIVNIFIAWTSIERHMLIFHMQWISNEKKKFLFHQLPFAILFSYSIFFYLYVIVFPPCINSFNYTLPVCGFSPCYYNHSILGMFDFMFNWIIPTLCIIVANFTLILRIIRQKLRLKQPIRWHQQRKITLQLVPISFLYAFFIVPIIGITLTEHVGMEQSYLVVQIKMYIVFFADFIFLLLPFAYFMSLPELWGKLRIPLRRRQHRADTSNSCRTYQAPLL